MDDKQLAAFATDGIRISIQDTAKRIRKLADELEEMDIPATKEKLPNVASALKKKAVEIKSEAGFVYDECADGILRVHTIRNQAD